MRRLIILFFAGVVLSTGPLLPLSGQGTAASRPPQGRDYLSRMFDAAGFRLRQAQLVSWRETRKKALIQKINALPDPIKNSLVSWANKSLSYSWPAFSANLSGEYKATGNRTDFEGKYNERRSALNSLVIAELITHDQKYLPSIVNGLKAVMAENTWVLPAHAPVKKSAGEPADTTFIDLGAGETAVDLGAIQWMLSAELDQFSPGIRDQVRYELDRMVLLPYLQRNDFWWMGFGKIVPNNWNPWINSNVLNTVLFMENSADTVNLFLAKILRSTDRFIDGYPEDGGCDEGPGYWNVAGGRLIRILDLTADISGNKLSAKQIPLLHKMGTYIYKMHIGGQYFVNFGDAAPKLIPDQQSIYQFGNYFGDDTLRGFAAYVFSLTKNPLSTNSVNDFLLGADLFGALSTSSPQEPGLSVAWMPQLGVLTAKAGSLGVGELFLAVQGGNNGKSHNHNDVGNFIIYVNGNPVIVDAGGGTYTATTFSKDRYSIWFTQSLWHNCPLINGVQQKAGPQFKATDVSFDEKPGLVSLSMDIGAAYPPDAGVKSWKRSFQFNTSDKSIDLDDSYELGTVKDTTCVNFLTSCAVKKIKEGQLAFTDNTGKDILLMNYDAAVFDIQTTLRPMDDSQMKGNWGDHLVRLSCIVKNKNPKGAEKFTFSLPKS